MVETEVACRASRLKPTDKVSETAPGYDPRAQTPDSRGIGTRGQGVMQAIVRGTIIIIVVCGLIIIIVVCGLTIIIVVVCGLIIIIVIWESSSSLTSSVVSSSSSSSVAS